jgi:DNA-binding beta-propeller fold protein YncE
MMRIPGPHLRSRLSIISATCLVLLAIVLVPQTGAGADRTKFEHPVMMDSNGPGSELYVLDDAGILHEFRVSDNSLEEYGRVSIPQDFKAADMSYARSEMPGSTLIAGTEAGRGLVLRFSLDGRSLQTWGFQNVCSGVDSGEANHTAYVATSDSNEIYKLDLRGQRIAPLARIPDATKLGPVAFDEARQEIYVADVASGRIYQYSIAAKSSKVFVTGLSAPTALVFDAETNQLFVADPGRRAVFVVDTRASKPVAAPFVSEPLKSPYGMTLISKGRVAVADYGANSVFVFSGQGKLLFRFSSPQ